jgi:hypothetical protein
VWGLLRVGAGRGVYTPPAPTMCMLSGTVSAGLACLTQQHWLLGKRENISSRRVLPVGTSVSGCHQHIWWMGPVVWNAPVHCCCSHGTHKVRRARRVHPPAQHTLGC